MKQEHSKSVGLDGKESHTITLVHNGARVAMLGKDKAATAERIAMCFNAHDTLVEALREIVEPKNDLRPARQIARTALKCLKTNEDCDCDKAGS